MLKNIICMALFMLAIASANDIVTTFRDSVVKSFNHLVVHKDSGRVYVGAVNRLFELSPTLEFLKYDITGPRRADPSKCLITHCDSSAPLSDIDNINKALVIDYDSNSLIFCGTVEQGLCSIYNLNDIWNFREISEAVVSNTENDSTVAFIAPGFESPVMYVGVTNTYRSDIPVISSRSLNPANLLKYAFQSETGSTYAYVNSLARERYPINYKYGFSSEGFSYFLTTQKKHLDSDEFTSKLVRICQSDEHYYSYTEIPIECNNLNENQNYNLAQAAYVGQVGSILAMNLNITTKDDVLFVAFNAGNEEQLDKSVICIYSLKSIRRKFTENIQQCMGGLGERGADHISPSHRCIKTQLVNITEDFCGIDVNTPLAGTLPVSEYGLINFNETLTAIAGTSSGDDTVIFLGTAKGHLKKVRIEFFHAAVELKDLTVDEGSAVNSDMLFDSKFKHLYVMTKNKVSKVRV